MNAPTTNDLKELNEKLDAVYAFVLEEKKRKQELDDLKKDITFIASDVYTAMVEELQDVSGHFTSDDLICLMKKMLRNTKNFGQMLNTLESANDFINDFKVVGDEIFKASLLYFEDKENKNLFRLLKHVIDTLEVTMMEVADDQIPENLSLLKIVREMNSKEAKRGLYVFIKLLKGFGNYHKDKKLIN